MKKRASKKILKVQKNEKKKTAIAEKKRISNQHIRRKKIRRALKKILKNEFPLNFIST